MSVSTFLMQDSTTSSVRYSSGWTVARGSGYSGGTEHYATRTSASATYTVKGARGFAIVSSKASTRGSIRVYVDGRLVATVSERSGTAYKVVVYARGLTYGASTSHAIKLVPAGNGRVDLDAFVILR